MEWDINSQWLFKSISSYRKLKTHSFIDIDASEYELGDVLVAMNPDQASQEFQLQYDNGRHRHGVFGAYYMTETYPPHPEAYADAPCRHPGGPIQSRRKTNASQTNTP